MRDEKRSRERMSKRQREREREKKEIDRWNGEKERGSKRKVNVRT